MSDLVKDVLRERAEVGPAHVDLADIMRQGDRRIRRRRLVTAACAAGTAVVLAATLMAPRVFDSSQPPADRLPARFAEPRLLYAVGGDGGTRIHYGDAVIETEVPVDAFVATDYGFVLTTATGNVWFTDGEDSDQIGEAVLGGGQLHSLVQVDDREPFAAWIEAEDEADGEQVPELVVYDTHQRREVARVAASETAVDSDPKAVVAVDGGAVYWHDGESLVRYEVATGESTVLAGSGEAWIWDVADGFILHRLPMMKPLENVLGRTIGSGRRLTGISPWAELSPDARYALDGSRVIDTRTNRTVQLQLPARYPDDSSVTAAGWSGNRTFILRKEASQDVENGIIPVAILTCRLPSGTCVKALETPVTDPGPVLPGYGGSR